MQAACPPFSSLKSLPTSSIDSDLESENEITLEAYMLSSSSIIIEAGWGLLQHMIKLPAPLSAVNLALYSAVHLDKFVSISMSKSKLHTSPSSTKA
eukprot:6213721-Pleurochrysis_carterae.AAC.2